MDMTRRSALFAAAAASMSASDAPAADGEARKLLQLRIVLPDGQTVDLKASEVIVDFGGTGKLAVKPEGVLPVVEIAAKQTSPDGDPFGPPQQRTQSLRSRSAVPLDDLNNSNPVNRNNQ